MRAITRGRLALWLLMPLGLAATVACSDDDSTEATDPRSETSERSESAGAEMPDAKLTTVLTVGDNFGKRMEQGAELAVEDLREAGTVDFEHVKEDAGDSNTTAINALRKAVEGEPDVMVGPLYGTMMLAISPEIERAGIPTLITTGSRSVTQQDNRWIFRYFPHDDIAKPALVNFATAELDIERPAILHSSDEYGQSGRDAMTKAFDEAGIEAATIQSMNNDDRDVSGQMRQIAESGADSLFVHIAPPNPNVVAIQGIRRAGLDIPLLWGSGITSPTVLDLVSDEDIAGIYAETAGLVETSDDPKVTDFVERYQAAFGVAPDIFALLTYDAVSMAGTAIADVGTDPEAIYEALSSMEYQGLVTAYQADEEGTMTHRSVVTQFDDARNLEEIGEFDVEFTPRSEE